MLTITLTSDFGLQDHLSASVKGQILQHSNQVPTLIDITHQIVPFNLPQAAYILKSAIDNFPPNSFHCVFLNLFEHNQREILCFYFNQQYIFCANNGLINLITQGEVVPIVSIALDASMPINIVSYVQTMVKAVNWLDGGGALENLGETKLDFIDKNNLKPLEGDNWLEGHIVFIDHYENVVTNISKNLFEKSRNNRKFQITFKRDEIINQISESYGSVQQGEKLALFNTSGYLEIAINQGNAAGLFGFQNYGNNTNATGLYLQKRMYYQTIKIYFE
jgi:S-adenosyl-L-methionine hydrolase (adenosine-forming)